MRLYFLLLFLQPYTRFPLTQAIKNNCTDKKRLAPTRFAFALSLEFENQIRRQGQNRIWTRRRRAPRIRIIIIYRRFGVRRR